VTVAAPSQKLFVPAFEHGLSAEYRRGAPADFVEDAARGCGAIENRCRALEDVERLKAVEVDANRRNRRRRRDGEPVDILLGRKATDRDEVVARVRTVVLAESAGRVAHRLLGIDEIQKVDLVARDDRNGLRRLDQRDVALGRGFRTLRNIVPGNDDDVAARGPRRLRRVACLLVARARIRSWGRRRRSLRVGDAGHQQSCAPHQLDVSAPGKPANLYPMCRHVTPLRARGVVTRPWPECFATEMYQKNQDARYGIGSLFVAGGPCACKNGLSRVLLQLPRARPVPAANGAIRRSRRAMPRPRCSKPELLLESSRRERPCRRYPRALAPSSAT
jgi:hypothetical protein